MKRVSLAAVFVGGVLVGCSLLADLDDLSAPSAAELADARAVDLPDAERADTTTGDVVDGEPPPREDASVPDGDAAPPLGTTRVSCSQPKTCADGEGCCVVYGGISDYCTDAGSKCRHGTDKVVFVPCDDETDCAALGMPGHVCCGTITFTNGEFVSVGCVPAGQCSGVELCDPQIRKCAAGRVCEKGSYANDVWVCE